MEQENSEEVHLVRDFLNSPRRPREGSFLFYAFEAFQRADSENYDLLLPAIRVLIKKYGLTCTCGKG